MNWLILFCIFISFKTLVVSAQDQECEILQPDGEKYLQPIEMYEKTPPGTVLTQLVIKHGNIDERKEEPHFSLVYKKEINSTHKIFDLIVASEYDLYKEFPMNEIVKPFKCQPGQGDNELLIIIKDVNDAPKFIGPNIVSFELFEKFPINLPFTKLYEPAIYVTDDDVYGTDFGKLEFIVWEDETFLSRSTVIGANAKEVDTGRRGNKYEVNLYLKQFLNPKVSTEHRVILMAKDKTANSLKATAEIKIVVQTDSIDRIQPKFDHKTYSAIVWTKNKSIDKSKDLDVKISAKIDDGSDIRYEIDKELSEFSTSFTVDTKGHVKIVDENPLAHGALTTTVIAIRAISVNQPTLSDVCLLRIKIVHIPDFNSSDYSLYTSRDSPVGTALWTANAGPFMTYSLTASSSHYRINNESGILDTKTELMDALDETLVVKASKTVDGKTEFATCRVTVRVVDSVQSFKQLKFDHNKYKSTIGIKNKVLDGGKILQFDPSPIKATNIDTTSGIKYEIDKNLSDCPNCFDIDVQNGKVEIINVDLLIDQSLTTSTLIIRAISTTNTLMFDTCSVSIRLVYKPEFVSNQKSSIYIDRKTSPKTVIWTSNAGPSQTYSIKDRSEHYEINETTGVVRVKSALDNAGKEVLTITASKEVKGKREFDEAQIEIHVVDNVESSTYLQFQDEPYSALVYVADGTLMTPVSLKTSGHGASSALYKIDPEPTECVGCFSIDEATGQLKVNNIKPLVQNKMTRISLGVKAFSSADKLYSDASLLSIQLVYEPAFSNRKYELYVSRTSPMYTALWTANAGPFMTYSLTVSSLHYRINKESGTVDTKTELKDALDETLVVKASKTVDGKTEFATCQVTVHVVDNVQSFTQLKFDHKKYKSTIGIKNKLDGGKILQFYPSPIKATNIDTTSGIKYEIDKNLSDCPNCFDINVQKGTVEIINLDELINQSLTTSTLIIRAISTTIAIMSDTCSVSIRLVYKPKFVTNENSSVYIDRKTPPKTVIWTSNAGPSQTYSIKDRSEHYEINETTGVVRVKSDNALDNAGKEVLTITASKEVEGKREFDEAQIEIHVVDNVESSTYLQFQDKPYSALVYVADGTLMTSVSLKTSGHGASSALYKIDPEPTECVGCFSIDEATGQLKVNNIKPLVQNKMTRISLSVKAFSSADKLYSDASLLSIQLAYKPAFSNRKYELYVSRTSPMHTALWTANAGPFMTYRLKSDSPYFSMNKDTGTLSITQSLESMVEETITVIASNEIEPKIGTDEAQVTIHVLDSAQRFARLNFESKKYTAVVDIKNNVLDGEKLLVTTPSILKAKMYDNSKIEYEIEKTLSDCADCFEIDDSGKLNIVKIEALMANNVTKTGLVIRAISSTNPLYSDLCSVYIQFVHKPKFASQKHVMYIPRNLTVNTVLWTAQAGPFMTYSIENPNAFYDLNGQSGAISIKNPLDKAQNRVVIVNAINGKSEVDQTQVSVNVVDNVESSTHVQFAHKTYSATIEIKDERLDGSDVLKMAADIKASTVETGGAVVYEIDKSRTEFSDSFAMNKDSAEMKIINLKPLIEKHLTKTTLILRATSTVNPLYSDMSTLSVRIIYKPHFKNKIYSVFVPRNSTEGTILWTAQAGPFLIYEIKDPSGLFDINEESGAVTIKTLLNTADKQQTITVIASTESDGKILSDSANLEIHIFDALKSVARPQFEHKQYSAVIGIKDKKLDGNAILEISPKIKASVSDNSLIHFEIDSLLTESATSFSIIDKTKAQVEIVNIQPLIEKHLTKTTLILKAVSTTDAQSYDVSCVLIRLVYKPTFQSKTHSVFTRRDAKIGTNLWTANAGPFVTYSLKDSSLLYKIDEESGIVSVITPLKNAGVETLNIVATGELGLGSDETHVTIHVLDDTVAQVGDKHSDNECSIEENAANAVCLVLSQTDEYQIIKGNGDQNFKLSEGQLLSNRHLDYEEKNSYFLTLHSEIAKKTLYVTVNVLDVNEAPNFETENEIFPIAPWIQPNNLITTFRAEDPDRPNSMNAAITYSILCAQNLSGVFNLNPKNGQLHWVEKPTEKVYFCKVSAKDGGVEPMSDLTEIKIFSLQVENIFSLKFEVQKQLGRRYSNIERELSEVLEKQVVVLLLKPDLQSQSKVEYELFALEGDSVLTYTEIERLLSSKKEKLTTKLGEHSFEPYKPFQLATEGTKGDELEDESIIIIALAAILGVVLALTIVIGFIIFRKYRSATLQNSTSRKALLADDEESNVETPKLGTDSETKTTDGESNDWVEELVLNKETNEVVEIRPERVWKNETIPRIVGVGEVAIEELEDLRYSELFEFPPKIDYEEPEIDYKLGERKNVSFKSEEVEIIYEEIDELQDVQDEEIEKLQDVENMYIEKVNYETIEDRKAEEEILKIDELKEKENTKLDELKAEEIVKSNEVKAKLDEVKPEENMQKDEFKPEEKMEKDELKPEATVETDELKPEATVKLDELKPEESMIIDELKSDNVNEERGDDSSNEDTEL